jgi:hypothetical protein
MKTVIIIGGGPSVKRGIAKDLWGKIRGMDIWALNYAYKTMPYFPTRELWLDKSFFKQNAPDLQRLAAEGVQLHARRFDMYVAIPEIHTYEITRNETEFDTAMYISTLGQVGPFALSIAIKESYDTIYLLGYDFGTVSPTDTFTHYYQDTHKVISSGIGRPDIYLMPSGHPVSHMKSFEIFASKHAGIYNVSLQSNLPYFPKISYEEFFEKIKL